MFASLQKLNTSYLTQVRNFSSCIIISQATRCLSESSHSRFDMNPAIEKDLKRAAQSIKNTKSIIITAGAGMGVDSGLPDFRGPEGFWKAYPPLMKLGLTLPETSTPSWFTRDPHFAWGFFGHRFHLYRNTQPHKGFSLLKKWCQSKEGNYFIFTSNVDGHFQKAGFSEEKIVECHGSINYLQEVNGSGDIWPAPKDFNVIVDEKTLHAKDPLPHGPPDAEPSKQQLARPNILMFGDWFFVEYRTNEQESRFADYLSKNLSDKSSSFVVIEIGAGAYVPTVRRQGERLVMNRDNGILIRINPRDTDIPSKKHVSLPMGALEALERIDMELAEL